MYGNLLNNTSILYIGIIRTEIKLLEVVQYT